MCGWRSGRRDIVHDADLLGPEVGGLPIKEVVIDPAIEPIHIHCVNSILHTALLTLESACGRG
jgi:hypothetical protein